MFSDSVRLVDGAGLCSGRVEVKSHQSWTTVCEADFDWQDAEVVCKELGCDSPLTLQGALFGGGKLPFGTKKFQCKGTENRLLTCRTSAREEHTCTFGKALGLICSEPDAVRLLGESSRCAGTVEMFHYGKWRKVGKDFWSIAAAAVVCRQLGCGSAVASTVRAPERNETELGVATDCMDSKSERWKCKIFSNSSLRTDAGVICSGLLEKPNISSSTPGRLSRGCNFTITCSIQPQYPGGSFYLTLPWNNRSHTKTAVNHSASFLFSATDDSFQGNYSCVYENEVTFQNVNFVVEDQWNFDDWFPGPFIHNFSSESEPLFLSVTGFPSSAFITRMMLVPFLMLMTCLTIFL
uniref:SRCR domain-containing protein n=1 Tax=Pygocentrus nattereri TaxID=42514 RepID=A0AAR2K380_PYGNA